MKKIVMLAVAGLTSALLANDGAALYKTKCASCHGADGKMVYAGKVKAMAGMPAADMTKKWGEYKAGTLNTYGMGAIMKANANNLLKTDDEVKAVADFIAGLK